MTSNTETTTETTFNLVHAIGSGHSGPYTTAPDTTLKDLIESLGVRIESVSIMMGQDTNPSLSTTIQPGTRIIINPAKVEGASTN